MTYRKTFFFPSLKAGAVRAAADAMLLAPEDLSSLASTCYACGRNDSRLWKNLSHVTIRCL